MAEMQEMLQFHFPNFRESILVRMDALRSQRRFCDVVVRINDLKIPGHKVVFAAGSPFLRDQFFLQDSPEVQISTLQDAAVGLKLLLSCYSGTLEFPELELVDYLAVASFLQMGHVVEKCTQALNKFIKPCQIRSKQVTQAPSSKARPFHPVAEPKQHQPESDDVYEIEDDCDLIIDHQSPPLASTSKGHDRTLEERDESNILEECDNSPVSIIKVEPVSNQLADSMCDGTSQSPGTLITPEPQHSLINSTVESQVGDSEMPLGHITEDPISPAQIAAGSFPVWGGLHVSDMGFQGYHQCPKCSRVFRQQENYVNHLKMHKLFVCLLCGKIITQKGNFHRHMRVHAGIKPFQCKICLKSFTQKCSLLDHLNLHSGDKPHRCNYCEMVFAHKPVLRKHLKQVHGKNSIDNANEGSLLELEVELGN